MTREKTKQQFNIMLAEKGLTLRKFCQLHGIVYTQAYSILRMAKHENKDKVNNLKRLLKLTYKDGNEWKIKED